MDASWLQPVLDWIGAHPWCAGLAVLVISALESLLIVGLFIPGTIIMFSIGALVANGAMGLATTLLWASAGAVLGDSLSYAIGHHYRDRLHALWPMSRHPGLMARGDAFFARHGGKSIVLGRFVGPVRPVVPAVAGAAGMAPLRFFIFNVISALLWAPLYILPGVVFGASLGLAARVASRLVVLAVMVLGILWLVVWLTRTAFAALHAPVEALILRLLDWSQRHRRLGHLGPSLADPAQPETPALALLALILLVLGWFAFTLVWGLAPVKHPQRLDAVVQHLFRGLRTPWTDPVAAALAQLSNWQVYLPVAGAVLANLLAARRLRAALHWIAAIAFGAALALGLHWLLAVPEPVDFYYRGATTGAFAGGHIILSTVIYGFLPVLLTTGRRRHRRWPYYGCAGTLIALIALARLYLGAHWLSDATIGTGIALAWVALLGLAYRRRHIRPVPTASLLTIASITLILAATVQWTFALPSFLARFQPIQKTVSMPVALWRGQGFGTLPAYRVDLEGRDNRPLNVQWSGRLDRIAASLAARGWRQPPRPTPSGLLHWLSDDSPIGALPVLPQVHDGRDEALLMVRPIDARQQQILHLWPSRWHIEADGRDEPLWIGNVSRQHIISILSILYLPAAESDFDGPRAALAMELPAMTLRTDIHPGALPAPRGVTWDGGVLLLHTPARSR